MIKTFNTHGGYFAPRGYSKVEEGGKHYENPYGGVQYGTDAQGVPNMLEEGEPVYDDFVYSDNIEAEADFLEQYNLPVKFAGKLYSEIADAFVDEAAERPLDATSNNGLNKMLARLAEAQEAQKQRQQQNELQTELDNLSPDEMQQLQTMLAGSGQEQGQPIATEDVTSAQQTMLPQEPQTLPGGFMAQGGLLRKFGAGGNAFEEGQDLSVAEPETLWLMQSDKDGNLYDTISPAVVTASLPNGMTQREARNRMDGYLFGQQVAKGRDQWGKGALNLADQATGGLVPPVALAASMANGDALGMGLNMAAYLLPFAAVLPADEAAKAAAQAKKLSTAKGQATRQINKLTKEIQVAEQAKDATKIAELKKLRASQEAAYKKAASELDELNKIRQPKPEAVATPEPPATTSAQSAPAPSAKPSAEKSRLWAKKNDPRYTAYKEEVSWTNVADKNKARNANILWNPVYNTRRLWKSELPLLQKAALTGRDLLWTPNIPANMGRLAVVGNVPKPHGYIDDAAPEFSEPILYHTIDVQRPNSYAGGGPIWEQPWTELPDDFFRWINWEEGFKNQSYGDNTNKTYNALEKIDPNDTLTIGYGRTYDVKPGDTTDRESEKTYLLKRLNENRAKLVSILKSQGMTDLTESQFNALLDLSYNGGPDLVRKIVQNSNGDPKKLRELLSSYATTNAKTKEKEPRLVRRAQNRVRMWDGKLPVHEGIYQYQLTKPELTADGYFGKATRDSLVKDGYSDAEITHFIATGELPNSSAVEAFYLPTVDAKPYLNPVTPPDTRLATRDSLSSDTSDGNEVTAPITESPTLPMYAGAINAGLSGLYNAFQKPDRYDYGTYAPYVPNAQAPHFVNPTFTPDDENRYVNDILAQGASMVRALQSSPGGSSRAALIAANNAITKNLSDARAQARTNNIAQRNSVNQLLNANASTLANFNLQNENARSTILNAAQQYNLQRQAEQQAANYAAESQKYAALQSNINAMADALAGIGRQNATLNRINNDPTFDYYTFLDGTTIKKGN